jgi:hypothetical protein
VSTEAAETVIRGRLAALPACLREVAGRVGAGAGAGLGRDGGVVVTGVGASEAPARMIAELWREAGVAASFAPLSAFASGSRAAKDRRGLVVFSQGLSPNARLALARAGEFREALVFTSVREDAALARFVAQGGRAVVLPPEREQGALVRVLGPCAAMLAAALHTGAAAADDVDALLAALAEAPARVPDTPRRARVAFVTAGGYGELCHAVKNAWLEGLCAPEPPVWDVLQIAHGPFQQFFDDEILLLALERGGEEHALWDRLATMLVPTRHTLVRLRSSLPRALAPIDHLVLVLELVCRALRHAPRDLGAWPGSGLDAPLYELGAEPTGNE